MYIVLILERNEMVEKSEFSCPYCRPKDEKIKELNKLLLLIINSWDNKTSRTLEKLIEKAREITEDAEV